MKIRINPFDYAETITKALKPGILLNTNGEKFNSMVIGWGHLGILWGMETFVVYVRQSRYTKQQLDRTKEFTISVPLEGKLSPEIIRIFGAQSGRDYNKADYVTLEEPEYIHTPGIREYPLTLECEVLYQQDQILNDIPQEVIGKYYAHEEDADNFHTVYVGKIVAAYIIKEGE